MYWPRAGCCCSVPSGRARSPNCAKPGRQSDAVVGGASDRATNHVNHFFDPHALGSALMQAGLAEPVLDVDRIVMRYADTTSR